MEIQADTHSPPPQTDRQMGRRGSAGILQYMHALDRGYTHAKRLIETQE